MLEEPPIAAPPELAATPAAKLVIFTSPMIGSVSVFGSSEAFDVMCTEPPVAVTTASCPTFASVSSLFRMLIETATPTPVPLLVLSAAPPETFWISLRLSAATSMSPEVELTCAFAPMLAVVSTSM